MRSNFPSSPGHIQVAHEHLRRALREGDVAIDATAGNGHDCLFLAQCIGASGSLYAFDVQESALEESKRRFEAKGLPCSVHWIHDSHAHVKKYVTQAPRGAIFNLGYLPGGDKSLITKAESTITALDALDRLLAPGAALSVVAYVGHEGGWEEYERVQEWAKSRPKDAWSFYEWRRLNRENAPIVIMGEKAISSQN